MRLLDRYVLQNFAIPFAYSTCGFLGIWLVFDLSGNGHDFIEAHIKLKELAYFYLTQFPQILVISLPVGLLLALLYSLSRMSRSNELISMLTAGRSVPRVLSPLFVAGIAAACFSLALNYSLAPHSDIMRKQLLDQYTKGREKSSDINQQLYRNRQDSRTWLIETIRKKQNQLRGVDISEQDADGNIVRKWYADQALYNPADHSWTLSRGKEVNFDTQGRIVRQDLSWLRGNKRITGWSETIWRLVSTNEDPQELSVDELAEYIRNNSDFPEVRLAPFRTQYWYRWAVPFQCIVVIFIAAPLGIIHSRRGVLAGVASSIFIFAAMLFLDKLFLALGRGDRLPAFLAAWSSNLIFLLVGVYLLHIRANNKELPSFTGMRRNVQPRPRLTPVIVTEA